MQTIIEELKICVRQYRDIDDRIREINKGVFDLREKRKVVEKEIAQCLKQPQLQQHNLITLEDGSKIKIQRPDQWSKNWSMSKANLSESLSSYFKTTPSPNAVDCFAYIVKQEKEKSVSNEFKLTRFVSDENLDNE